MSAPARRYIPNAARPARRTYDRADYPSSAVPSMLPHPWHQRSTAAVPMRDVQHLPLDQRPNCLLVQVPNTVLPSDVLRAMKEAHAADRRITLGNLTPYPIGALRRASFHTQYHITTSSHSAATTMHRLISQRPLFAATTGVVGRANPRPERGLRDEGLREMTAVGFCMLQRREWAASLIWRAESSAASRGGIQWDRIDADWAINPALSGRRVILGGLPGLMPHHSVRNLVGEYAQDDDMAVLRLPPQLWSSISCWAVTCQSVTRAHDLARRFNANHYLQSQHGHKFPMFAEVIW